MVGVFVLHYGGGGARPPVSTHFGLVGVLAVRAQKKGPATRQ